MKLMDIDQEHLGIPDTVYEAEITLPSAEFSRVIRDLKELGESVRIEVDKEGIRFSCEGDIASASVTLKATQGSKVKSDAEDEDEEEEEEDEEEDEDEDVEMSASKSKKKKTTRVTVIDDEEEEEKPAVSDDEDEEEDEEAAAQLAKDKKEKEKEKKRKAAAEVKAKAAKKAKLDKKKPVEKPKGRAVKDKDEVSNHKVTISLQQSVNLSFSAKVSRFPALHSCPLREPELTQPLAQYLSNFCKSAALSDTVVVSCSRFVLYWCLELTLVDLSAPHVDRGSSLGKSDYISEFLDCADRNLVACRSNTSLSRDT